MKTNHNVNRLLAISAVGMVAASVANAQQVTMNFVDIGTYAQSVPTQTLPDGASWSPGAYGVYSFNVSVITDGTIPGLAAGDTFWSTCLSPGGDVDGCSYTYNYQTFAAASPGLNPAAWTSGNGQLWGIQNAQYLWKTFGSSSSGLQTIPVGTQAKQDAGTALELAMYVALYDSTGYGAYTLGAFNPTVASGLSQNVYDEMNADLGVLNPIAVGNNLANGYLLTPTSGESAGQQFIIMVPGSAVPEPAAYGALAAACLLLVFLGQQFHRKQV